VNLLFFSNNCVTARIFSKHMPSNAKSIKETLKGILMSKIEFEKQPECNTSKGFSLKLFKVNKGLYTIL
jgi:hypothetical protein